jgi:release factor glutamine methyltransferase
MTISPHSLPVQVCRFGPLDIEYDERVLVPRPWSLVQSVWAAELICGAEHGPLLELFAGAGHIGLAAAVLADVDLVQVELDSVAAGYARRNAARAGRADRVEVRVGSIAATLRPDETFRVIIADPPYLPSAEVRSWPDDPVRAIDGGPDGLDLIRLCLDVVEPHLQPSGRLLLQLAGPDQAGQVCDLLGTRPEGTLEMVDERIVDVRRSVALLARRR